jgi:hypothetical protein
VLQDGYPAQCLGRTEDKWAAPELNGRRLHLSALLWILDLAPIILYRGSTALGGPQADRMSRLCRIGLPPLRGFRYFSSDILFILSSSFIRVPSNYLVVSSTYLYTGRVVLTPQSFVLCTPLRVSLLIYVFVDGSAECFCRLNQ